jgi:hypothetical protein
MVISGDFRHSFRFLSGARILSVGIARSLSFRETLRFDPSALFDQSDTNRSPPTGLIIGVAAGVSLIGVIVIVSVFVKKRRTAQKCDEEPSSDMGVQIVDDTVTGTIDGTLAGHRDSFTYDGVPSTINTLTETLLSSDQSVMGLPLL